MKATLHYTTIYNYNSCMPLSLPSGKRSSMPDWALSQKCLSADATIQNRRHSEQVTTAENKNVTAGEVKREANRYTGLLQPFLKSFQPPLESKRKKGARLAWDCMSCPSSPNGSSSYQATSSNLFGSCSRGWSRTRHGQAHHHI